MGHHLAYTDQDKNRGSVTEVAMSRLVTGQIQTLMTGAIARME